MEAQQILLADSDTTYRNTVQQLLERSGYQVLAVADAAAARALLGREYMDLAILEVRLQDTADAQDKSGLQLARELGAALPKLIVTGYLTPQLVREALAQTENGTALAVDVLDKAEGLANLLKAVEAAIGPPQRALRRVFLSYSTKDKLLARKIQATLKGSGLEVWEADNEIFPGDNWAEKMGHALKKSDAMVVLLSPASVESLNVKNDIEYALFNRSFEHRLIPVLVGDPQQIPPNKYPWILRRMKMINLPDNGHSEDLEQIVTALKAAA